MKPSLFSDDKNLHAHKRPDPEKFFPTKRAAGAKDDPGIVPTLPPAKPKD
jgi:hypothetical protein